MLDSPASLRLDAAEFGVTEQGHTTDNGRAHRPFVLTRPIKDISGETISWVWPDRIPAGKLTVLAGDPGLGKSWLTLDIAARLSSGVGWPDIRQPIEPGASLILSGEDDAGDTIRPRLEQANADLSRIHHVDGVQRSRDGELAYFQCDTDLAALEQTIIEVDAKMLIIDPLSCFLGNVDSHRDADIRGILGPLATMAGRTGCAVVYVSHLSKSGSSKALNRVMGSLAVVAAARVGWLIGKDRDNDKRRIMCPLKANIIADPKAIGYEIVDGVIHWYTDQANVSADSLMAETSTQDRADDAEAETWLMEILALGPMLVREIREAAKAQGQGYNAVDRAFKTLGVKASRKGDGRQRPWYWELPTDE